MVSDTHPVIWNSACFQPWTYWVKRFLQQYIYLKIVTLFRKNVVSIYYSKLVSYTPVGGWIAGATCQTNIEECASQPCQHGGLCIDLINGYHCNCTADYTGASCEIHMDPCFNNPCHNNATCHLKSAKDYYCECIPGERIHKQLVATIILGGATYFVGRKFKSYPKLSD